MSQYGSAKYGEVLYGDFPYIDITTTIHIPSVSTSVNVSPTVVDVQLSINNPTVNLGMNISPSVVDLQLSIINPAISTSVSISPTVIDSQPSIVIPAISTSVTVFPLVVNFQLAINAPSISTSVNMSPLVIAPQLAINNPSVSTGVNVTSPLVSDSQLSINSPSIHLSVNVSVPISDITTTINTPTISSSSILGDFIAGKEYRYELYLCKPYIPANQVGSPVTKEIVACLTNCISDLSVKKALRNVDEVEFNLFAKLNDIDNTVNPAFDLTTSGMFLLLETYIDDTCKEREYFYVYQTSLNAADIDTKSVSGYSINYQWNKSKIKRFQDSDTFSSTRKIYDGQTFDVSDITKGGILDYILQEKLENTWSVSYISASLQNVYRVFDISEKTLLEVVRDIEDKFNCVFFFDNFNFTVSIKSYAELPTQTGLVLSGDNYINSLKQQIKIDEIVTRLYVEGDSDTTISGVNITGQAYIDNFSYFRNDTYMSQSLQDALTAYDIVKANAGSTYAGYLASLSTKQGELTVLNDQKYDLTTTLHTYQDNGDVAISQGTCNGHDYPYWFNLATTQQASIDSKQSAITSKEGEITSVLSSISALNATLDYSSNFTSTQLQELLLFVNEDTVKCNTTDDAELLSFGLSVLAIKSVPPIDFELDLVDFFSCQSERYAWDKLELGALVDLELADYSIESSPRIISYTHSQDGNSLSVTVSNKSYLNSVEDYIGAIFAQSKQSATILTNEQSIYKEYSADKSAILTTGSGINTANNIVTMGDGSVLDRRGMFMRQIQSSSGQMRILANKILMTKDNWANYSTAITSDGIYASNLWVLTNSDGSVQINGTSIDITNMDLNMSANSGKNTIKISPTDGIKILKSTTPVFSVDSNGNLSITGNITMNGGSISWSNLDSRDPTIATAQSTANTAVSNASTAQSTANSIAAGTYNAPGTPTFIDQNMIYSARILNSMSGLSEEGTADSSIRIYAGSLYNNRAYAPFRVTQSGIMTCTGATIQTAATGTRMIIASGGISSYKLINSTDYLHGLQYSPGFNDFSFYNGGSLAFNIVGQGTSVDIGYGTYYSLTLSEANIADCTGVWNFSTATLTGTKKIYTQSTSAGIPTDGNCIWVKTA